MPRLSCPRNAAHVRPPVNSWKSPALLCALLTLCLGAASSLVSPKSHAQSQAVSFAGPVNKPYSKHGRAAVRIRRGRYT
jgi:hypothetical protein